MSKFIFVSFPGLTQLTDGVATQKTVDLSYEQ